VRTLITSNPTNRFADHHQSSALSRRSLIPFSGDHHAR
jgi:hypothetical protein